MKVFLTEIKIKGYRSCQNLVFAPQEGLSTLIGINGSGKTNILQGIVLLKKILSFGAGRTFGSRTAFVGENLSSSPCQIDAKFSVDGKIIQYRAKLRLSTTAQNNDEVIAASESWNFTAITDKNQWTPINLMTLGGIPEVGLSQNISLEQAFKSKNLSAATEKIIVRSFNEISHYVFSIQYYGATQFAEPNRCPSAIEIDERNNLINLPSNSDHHEVFLYNLFSSKEHHPDQYTRFISFIGVEGLGLIDKLTWKTVELSSNVVEVQLGSKFVKKTKSRSLIIPNIEIGTSQLSPNQLSEGTFKTLALLFYLFTNQSKLLLIEEPEVCVHHDMLIGVMTAIKEFSREKQIIFSTHSDFVLDLLVPENVYLVKNTEKSGTTAKAMTKTMSNKNIRALNEYLLTQGNLGEYWRSGGMEE